MGITDEKTKRTSTNANLLEIIELLRASDMNTVTFVGRITKDGRGRLYIYIPKSVAALLEPIIPGRSYKVSIKPLNALPR